VCVCVSFHRFSKQLKAIKEKENVIQLSSSLCQVCFKRAIKKAPEVSWDFFFSSFPPEERKNERTSEQVSKGGDVHTHFSSSAEPSTEGKGALGTRFITRLFYFIFWPEGAGSLAPLIRSHLLGPFSFFASFFFFILNLLLPFPYSPVSIYPSPCLDDETMQIKNCKVFLCVVGTHSFITYVAQPAGATPASSVAGAAGVNDPKTILSSLLSLSLSPRRPFAVVVATSTARGFYSGRLALLLQRYTEHTHTNASRRRERGHTLDKSSRRHTPKG